MLKKHLKFSKKNKHYELACRFSAYLFYKVSECVRLLEAGLTHEEIDSALFPLYLEEKKEYDKHIIEMEHMGADIIKKMMRKND